jgi:radical SAM superfamily enzyme YgiQ (UPF0313 family)
MNKKRLLLVNTNTETSPYPVPPVGLCLLASALEHTYDVRVFDGTFLPPQSLVALVKEFSPDYIGIGIRNVDNVVIDNSVYYPEVIHSRFVKPLREATTAPLIAGGSGFSVFPHDLVAQLDVDFGIVGEGEESLAQLLDALDKKEDPTGIPGVVVGKGSADNFVPSVYPKSFASLPFSSIDHWIDFAPYAPRGAYPIQTKRGCDHKCVYCTYPAIEGTAYRMRSPHLVAEEIGLARSRLGNVMFEFVDSTFNDPAGHAEAVCRALIGKKISARLRTMGINPAHASSELFGLMRAAGFTQIDCTPDSGSSTMLANFRKNFSLAQLQRTAHLIREADMPTMWFFVFGGPGETEDTIEETFSFVDSFVQPLDMVYMMVGLRIYPNTELCTIARQEGVIRPHNTLQRPAFYVSPVLGKERIDASLKNASAIRHNCVLAAESKPSPEMMKRATELRLQGFGNEPMFRTLLRVRMEMMPQ